MSAFWALVGFVAASKRLTRTHASDNANLILGNRNARSYVCRVSYRR